MRVVHVVSSDRFAGVERYIAYAAPALVERGWEVTVVGGDPAVMRAELGGAGVAYLPARNVVEAARKVAGQRRADIVHAHMTSAEWAAVATLPLTRAALVCTRHFAAVRGRPGVVRTLSRVIPRVFDAQLAISSFVASAIGEPSIVVPNGVPARETPAVDRREALVLVLQRLEAEKSTSLAIDAWGRSRAASLGWRMLVAGSGSEERRLRDQAAALTPAGSVEFIGHCRNVPALFDRAGVLLATAAFEPFGLSVVEAMASGVPVVAAAGGAHLETVGTCSPDYLFAPGDADDCAARLDALVTDAGIRNAYGASLQSHQRAHFALDRHVDRVVEVYEGLLGPR